MRNHGTATIIVALGCLLVLPAAARAQSAIAGAVRDASGAALPGGTGRPAVLARDVLDSVATGRTLQTVGQLVVGVTLNVPDVGGSGAMQQTYMSVHGLSSSQVTTQVDGMMVNGLDGDGAVQNYFNNMMSQEMSYQTAGAGTDVSGGGLRVNMIPKEGGNPYSGSVLGRM